MRSQSKVVIALEAVRSVSPGDKYGQVSQAALIDMLEWVLERDTTGAKLFGNIVGAFEGEVTEKLSAIRRGR